MFYLKYSYTSKMSIYFHFFIFLAIITAVLHISSVNGDKKCNCNEKPKKKILPSNGRIFGGEDIVDIQEVPWFILIESTHDSGQNICGGTLISNHIVITAAHCFYTRDGKYT